MTLDRDAVARAMTDVLYGPPTATIALRHDGDAAAIPTALDVLVQLNDDGAPPWSTLATAGMSAVTLPGAVPRAELLLRIDGRHTVAALEPLARALGDLAVAPFRRGFALADELIVTDVGLPGLGDRGAAVVLAGWSGDHVELPGVSPPVRLLEVWPLAAEEVELARAHGLAAVRRARTAAPAPRVDRAPTPPSTPAIERVCDRLEAWLAAHAPRVRADLGAGATPGQLAALAATLGVALPADLAAWLARHDGGAALGAYACLSTAGIAATAAAWRQRVAGWRRAWIPVAEDGCGNLACVEVDPDRAPAIVFFEVDTGPERSGLPSFTAWLDSVVTALERGDYQADDSGQLVPRA